MGRQCHQPVAFDQAFPHQANLSILEIAKPAMDKPRRPGGGAGGDVAVVDHEHIDSRERELPGNGGAVDASPEHDDRFFGWHMSVVAAAAGGMLRGTDPQVFSGRRCS